ncbi:hypothetical protein, partial [Nevskia sp.]|uniref:hypothetical protein n=1 Tax=Nevskia sp. TaxID=1929292 RepID=UPI0025FB55FD
GTGCGVGVSSGFLGADIWCQWGFGAAIYLVGELRFEKSRKINCLMRMHRLIVRSSRFNRVEAEDCVTASFAGITVRELR